MLQVRQLIWAALAVAAVAVPTLIAFNVPPSATFFNQAAALVGWGLFLVACAIQLRATAYPSSREALSLLAAIALIAFSALGASIVMGAPWSMSLSTTGTLLAAGLAAAIAATMSRAGLGHEVFRGFCLALVVAGFASSLIGIVQVYAPPALPDGNWVAPSSMTGRASGNVRQPNHLSTLVLWSIVAVVWLGDRNRLARTLAAAIALLFIYVVMLSGSRTGLVGMFTLAIWGALDRRLSKPARVLLVLAPVAYAASFWATGLWLAPGQAVGAQLRLGGGVDLSTNRPIIWLNTLALIASHPWLGVGFGEFNFAWTLTPFPNRPQEFFDHSHNIVLNLFAELGIPLGLLVIGLFLFAMWRGLRNAIFQGRAYVERPFQRAAFVMVALISVHSMLEYPLWYAYFLLPTAFAFGLCLERRDEGPPTVAERAAESSRDTRRARPLVLASMLLVLGGSLALWDYLRVVVIFDPPATAAPLEQRIADGRTKSVLFAHHADYAATTVTQTPGKVIDAFDRATHFLLDSRLMIAWARALAETGQHEKARYLAARIREFRNPDTEAFFEPCNPANVAGLLASDAARQATTARSASAPAVPFQCQAPQREFRFEDFR